MAKKKEVASATEEEELNLNSEELEELMPDPVEAVAEESSVNPKLAVETVLVQKDENGNGGTPVKGIVSADRKSVTTLEGVTFAL